MINIILYDLCFYHNYYVKASKTLITITQFNGFNKNVIYGRKK